MHKIIFVLLFVVFSMEFYPFTSTDVATHPAPRPHTTPHHAAHDTHTTLYATLHTAYYAALHRSSHNAVRCPHVMHAAAVTLRCRALNGTPHATLLCHTCRTPLRLGRIPRYSACFTACHGPSYRTALLYDVQLHHAACCAHRTAHYIY